MALTREFPSSELHCEKSISTLLTSKHAQKKLGRRGGGGELIVAVAVLLRILMTAASIKRALARSPLCSLVHARGPFAHAKPR